MSNHCLHFDCGQKVFCGFPQQQMSSLQETNLVLILSVDVVSHQAVYIIECIFSPSLTPFSLTCFSSLQSVSFILLLLSVFFCSCSHHGMLRSLHLARKKYFQSYTYLHSFLPFVKLQNQCLTSLVFSPLYVSLHLAASYFFLSCNSSTYHHSTRSSHLLSKQLGFLNSRLWQ